jgi:uncharacterized repeat protein (TIGR03803 family)
MHQLRIKSILALSIFAFIAQFSYAQKFSVLYNFGSGTQDPEQPSYAGIIAQGQDGNLYSTAPYSEGGEGAAFVITPAGQFSVLYTFENSSSGNTPYSGLVLGIDGNLYGTTLYGYQNYGTVFNLSTSGVETPLYEFAGGSDGSSPYAPPIQATDGNFYGTTAGYYTQTYGTVYQMSPTGSETVLYVFDEQHGSHPYAPLVQGTDGNFYGVTSAGGNLNFGVVFSITPSGSFRVLYNFDREHGSTPIGPLVEGNDGRFYGTTAYGGKHNSGVIFKITTAGYLKVVYTFAGSGSGFYPAGGLVLASDGNFYGTTHSGGPTDGGVIFQLSPKGKYKVLHRFNGKDGKRPLVTLTQHTNGILYGDTEDGGTGSNNCRDDCGVFYSLDMQLPPFVSVSPASGEVGDMVNILGQGFTGTSNVSFNGVSANFNVVSDTFLTATVPNGATTGFVTVTTPSGTLKSNRKFQVTN